MLLVKIKVSVLKNNMKTDHVNFYITKRRFILTVELDQCYDK